MVRQTYQDSFQNFGDFCLVPDFNRGKCFFILDINNSTVDLRCLYVYGYFVPMLIGMFSGVLD